MKIGGYIVDSVVFGVSRCGEFVYVLQCGSLKVTNNITITHKMLTYKKSTHE
jgi:hypothetical protein